MAYALLGEKFMLYQSTGMFGRSYCMWMNIDPHLLIFAMLPPLITGDAVAIDTSVARAVYRQCIHLAGPGVLFCAFVTAFFLKWYLPYDWSFLLCLTVGSILAATDPVAVVNLLKELGASPALTVQIQGESLLNDGTAIVLYSVCYKMMEGEEFGTNDVVLFLLKVVLLACLVGVVLGWCCTVWIRLSCRRLDDHACFVQISITLLCAYWSFILAEGLFGMSGVLTTVSSALVLADKMWPSIVSKESMDNAWHMFEFMGNTAIFFLAGSWTGNIMYQIGAKDYLHLLVIYIACNVVRGVMLLLSMPILRLLGQDKQPVSLADTAVMCWGGLRGAVGLSLAIHLSMDRAGGQIDTLDGKRILFFTSGIAALTLLVNATTCPLLVKWLGIARTSTTQQTIMQTVHYQLVNMANSQTRQKSADRKEVSEEVNELTHIIGQIMDGMLQDVDHHISASGNRWRTLLGFRQPEEAAAAHAPQAGEGGGGWAPVSSAVSVMSVDDGPRLLMVAQAARTAYADVDNEMLELLRFPRVEEEEAEAQNELFATISRTHPNRSMHRVVNEAFLCLLRAQYWAMNARGEFLDYDDVRATLLQSLGTSAETSSSSSLLVDLRFIVTWAMREGDLSIEEVGYDFDLDVLGIASDPEQSVPEANIFAKIESSAVFGVTMVLVILANTVIIAIELSTESDDWYMPVLNLGFALAYLFEFAIRFGALKWGYFCDAWNVFDFSLLLIGLAGSVLEFLMMTEHMSQSQSARIARVVKLFRIIRNVRVGVRVLLSAKKHGITRIDITKGISGIISALRNARNSDQTELRVRYIHILCSFVKSHLHCQKQFIQFFGKDGKLHSTEAARCLLASQTEVCAATVMACNVAAMVEGSALEALYVLSECNRVAEDLLHFVDSAHSSGILGAREAETLQHPLKAHMRDINDKLHLAVQGGFGIEPRKDGVSTASWFQRLLSLEGGMVMSSRSSRSSVLNRSRRPSLCSLDHLAAGIQRRRSFCAEEKQPSPDGSTKPFPSEGSEWNVRVMRTSINSMDGKLDNSEMAAEYVHECLKKDAMFVDSAAVPRPSPPPPSPPPSLPPSPPGSPPASPRCPECPAPPPQA